MYISTHKQQAHLNTYTELSTKITIYTIALRLTSPKLFTKVANTLELQFKHITHQTEGLQLVVGINRGYHR